MTITVYSGDTKVNVVSLMMALSEAISALEKARKFERDVVEYVVFEYQTGYHGFIGKINKVKEFFGLRPVPEEAATWLGRPFVPQQLRDDYLRALHYRQVEYTALMNMWHDIGTKRESGETHVFISNRQHDLVKGYLR